MKFISTLVTPVSQRRTKELFLSPYFSAKSLGYECPNPLSSLFLTFFLAISLIVIMVHLSRLMNIQFGYLEVVLLSPVILFVTEAAGALGQILFYRACPGSFAIHHRPLSSQTLSQFWGRHWNLWIQDWLKDVSRPLRGQRVKKMIAIFLASGLFHEVLINLPYWISYRKSYFGTMMAYFLCQAIGLEIEKRFLRFSPLLVKRLFMILVVFLPSPLFVNVPVLTFLGFMNE